MAFTLPDKKVRVKPNFDNAGWIKNPKHLAFFKMEGAYESYPVTMDRNGKLKNPFTKEEKEYLESVLGQEGILSVHNKNGLLHEIHIRLTKDPLELDLSDPDDYIKYKVLLTATDKIASSLMEKNKKKTYKFYIEDQDDVITMNKSKSTISQRAWKAYGKMEDSKKDLAAFLKVYAQVFKKTGNKIDKDTKIEFLQSQVADIVESNTTSFVEIVENPDFDTILLIAKATEANVIRRDGTKYSIVEGGDILGSTLKETINYLKAPVNQDVVFTLEEQIKLKE